MIDITEESPGRSILTTFVDLVFPPSLSRRALLILVAAIAVLAAVWTFESFGYVPCELCLTERYAFYFGAPLAALTAYAASRSAHGMARVAFALLALIFIANVALAVYHVGVEPERVNDSETPGLVI